MCAVKLSKPSILILNSEKDYKKFLSNLLVTLPMMETHCWTKRALSRREIIARK